MSENSYRPGSENSYRPGLGNIKIWQGLKKSAKFLKTVKK